MRIPKKALIAGGIVLLLALPFIAKRGDGDAVEVQVATAAPQSIRPTILASGTLAFRTEVKLTSEVLAQVSEVLVKDGDRVQRGQVLLRLDPETYRNAIEREEASRRQALISIERQRVTLALREKQFERYQRLAEAQTIDRARFDEEKNQLELARIELKSSEESLKRSEAILADARETLQKTEVVAPIDGTVVGVTIKAGETAVPSTQAFAGAQLMTIADTSAIEARLKVDEGDIAKVAAGQKVDVYPAAFPDIAVPGVVRQVALAPILENQGRAYEVIAELTPPEGLAMRSGMSARADLFLGDGASTLAVPVEAVIASEPEPRKTAHHVWRIVDGKVSKIEVQVGEADDRWQAITSGLSEGDRVVSGPGRALRQLMEGGSVKEIEAKDDEDAEEDGASDADAEDTDAEDDAG
ncbi:efflux RND transporter periplasmic adaptor subunit [Silanimonas sp.]|jgi:HlyD family secretion protein|uniref:efflux RND transporter periplasmic adaptor subunit n=1 Tax=Silanimonas sp. TaxID=1929290 RepID=UPI0022BF821C|nr:efflux RND transporter periplasmic adaptor subunit [Silanimonas sp.]MCZ8115579.1 efflux RND transporter periplasmic adaptor subunit [Silanimonas sp.]